MRYSIGPLGCFASAAFLLALSPARARADEPTTRFSLGWARMPDATSCIPGAELAAQVEERLGRPVFDAPARADVGIEGHVERAEPGWRATVSITDPKGIVTGTRQLSTAAASCRELDAPLALTIALFIDPNAALTAPPSPPVPAPEPPPRPEPPPVVKVPEIPPLPPSAPAPRIQRAWGSAGMLGATLGVGVLPRAAFGIVLRTEVVPPRLWPIAVEATLYGDERVTAPQNGAPTTFSLELAGVSTCPFGLASVLLGVRVCAAVEAGALSTEGLAGDSALTRNRFVAAGFARAEGFLNFGRHFFLAGSPSLIVPFVRDSFDYAWNHDKKQLFQMSPLAFAASLGLGFRAP